MSAKSRTGKSFDGAKFFVLACDWLATLTLFLVHARLFTISEDSGPCRFFSLVRTYFTYENPSDVSFVDCRGCVRGYFVRGA